MGITEKSDLEVGRNQDKPTQLPRQAPRGLQERVSEVLWKWNLIREGQTDYSAGSTTSLNEERSVYRCTSRYKQSKPFHLRLAEEYLAKVHFYKHETIFGTRDNHKVQKNAGRKLPFSGKEHS